MRKLLISKLLIAILITVFAFIAVPSYALNPSAGSVTSGSDAEIGTSGVRLFQISYTTHASAGTFTCASDRDITGWILLVETDPGATAPTDQYDITLINSNSRDVMGGALANRSDTNTEAVMPLQNGNYTIVYNEGPLTVTVTNAGNSKTAEILIYYLP